MGRSRIVRPLAAGAGSEANTHAPAAFSVDLGGPIVESPNFKVPRGEREFQFPICTHHSKIAWGSQVGAADFEGGGDRIFAIPTDKGLGRRQTIKIEGKYSVDDGSRGTPVGKRTPYDSHPAMGKSNACHESRSAMARIRGWPRMGIDEAQGVPHHLYLAHVENRREDIEKKERPVYRPSFRPLGARSLYL